MELFINTFFIFYLNKEIFAMLIICQAKYEWKYRKTSASFKEIMKDRPRKIILKLNHRPELPSYK